MLKPRIVDVIISDVGQAVLSKSIRGAELQNK